MERYQKRWSALATTLKEVRIVKDFEKDGHVYIKQLKRYFPEQFD